MTPNDYPESEHPTIGPDEAGDGADDAPGAASNGEQSSSLHDMPTIEASPDGADSGASAGGSLLDPAAGAEKIGT